jgi:hypothetical protein
MCRINVIIVAVTLWFAASASLLITENVHYNKEENVIIPTIQNGEYGTLYNKEVNNTVEYIFVFNKSEVSQSSHQTKNRIGICLVTVGLFYTRFGHFCSKNFL